MRLAAILAVAVAIGAAPAVTAQVADSPQARFAAAAAALERGAFETAIAELETLADRGFSHPDASFNRAAAYVSRARSPQARPGDLGRAAAGFAEAMQLRPGDETAEQALEQVRSEIARRRSREGAEPVSARPTLARAVVGLLSETTWSIAALIGALLLTVGLGLRLFGRRAPVRLTGAVAAPIGGVVLLLCGCLAAGASYFRNSSQTAVVVAKEARLLEATGVPVQQVDGVPEHVAIPEGATVYVLERQGSSSRVEWGTTRAWVMSTQLRVLASP